MKRTRRQYLNIITCSHATARGTEILRRTLIRPYRLTPIGAERILHTMRQREDDPQGIDRDTHVHDVSVSECVR